MHFSLKIWHLWATVLIIFLWTNWPNLVQFKQIGAKMVAKWKNRGFQNTMFDPRKISWGHLTRPPDPWFSRRCFGGRQNCTTLYATALLFKPCPVHMECCILSACVTKLLSLPRDNGMHFCLRSLGSNINLKRKRRQESIYHWEMGKHYRSQTGTVCAATQQPLDLIKTANYSLIN